MSPLLTLAGEVVSAAFGLCGLLYLLVSGAYHTYGLPEFIGASALLLTAFAYGISAIIKRWSVAGRAMQLSQETSPRALVEALKESVKDGVVTAVAAKRLYDLGNSAGKTTGAGKSEFLPQARRGGSHDVHTCK
jgi:hypothetical protein